MRRGLAVRDYHDLAVPGPVTRQDPPRQHEAVLEVRAVLVAVPGQLGQCLRPDLARVVSEPDDRQMVTRELRPDERIQGHGDLLGRDETASQQHRSAHVHEEHGRRRCQLLCSKDLEVRRRKPDRAAVMSRLAVFVPRQGIP